MAQVMWMATTKVMFTSNQPRVIVGIENDRHCVWRKRPWIQLDMDPISWDPWYVAPHTPTQDAIQMMAVQREAEQRIAMAIGRPRSNILDITQA